MTTNRCLDGKVTPALMFALLVCACATNPQITDTSGRKVNFDTPHVAERHLGAGRVVVYANTPDDIDRLIRELQQLGVTDRQILNPEAWSQGLCKMGNPPCPTNCTTGKPCRLVGVDSASRQVVPTERSNFSTIIKWCECQP